MKKLLLSLFAGLVLVASLAFAIEINAPVITGGSTSGMTNLAPNYGLVPTITTATTYSVTTTDETIIFNAAGTATVTLPTASSNVGRRLRILTVASQTVNSASSNVIPCTSTSAGTAIVANTAGKWIEMVADGVAGTSNWRCTASN